MHTDNKKKRTKHMLCIIIVILLVIFFLIEWSVSKGYFNKFRGPEICIDDQCFKLEIADTPKTREIGLMNRTSLDEDKGMLFVFEQPGVFGFWMKNTLIPLDMIWMDANYKIVYIQNMAQPCTANPCPTYNPGVPANYVLELNGGTAQRLGIRMGDAMKFKK